MKVSQITHCMERDAELHIIDSSLSVEQMFLFMGPRKDLHKDNELNKKHVRSIYAIYDVIVIDVAERKSYEKIRKSD